MKRKTIFDVMPELLSDNSFELDAYMFRIPKVQDLYIEVCTRLADEKKRSGKFNAAKARKTFLDIVNNAAKKYAAEFGGKWDEIFPLDCRMTVASSIVADAKEEVERILLDGSSSTRLISCRYY